LYFNHYHNRHAAVFILRQVDTVEERKVLTRNASFRWKEPYLAFLLPLSRGEFHSKMNNYDEVQGSLTGLGFILARADMLRARGLARSDQKNVTKDHKVSEIKVVVAYPKSQSTVKRN
jgi:hypothetical protein